MTPLTPFRGCERSVPPATLRAHMPVDDVMRRWPQTIRVFIKWRMKCVGCPFGAFHSISHACEEHAADAAAFLAALEQAVAKAPLNPKHPRSPSGDADREW